MDASKVEHTKEVEKLDANENSPKNLEAQPGSQALGDSEDPSDKVKSVDDVRLVETDGIGSKDSGSSNDGDDGVASRTKEDGISRTKSSSHEHSLSRIKDVCMDEVEDHSSAQSSDHHSDVYEFGKAEVGVKDYGTKEKSNDEVDYDIVDPLEVARQVAIEVEKEVGDRREQSCSSSDKALQKGSEHPDSPESSHETESRPQKELSEEVPLRFDLSAEGQETSPESLDHDEPKKGTLECSQLTEVAQGPPADAEKSQCGFDLNEEVSSEDVDQSENPHISIVSASRATAAPGLPNSPLQFKGSLGWKGSAATSAFRPASPRRIPEIDKVHSTGGSNSSSTQRDGCLDIDLNLDECIFDETVEKQARGSGLPSGESSLEVSTRVVSERVELDLNRGTDDSDAPTEWQTERDYYYQPVSGSGYVGQSVSSSSSSEQQHYLKHIDLNCPSSNSESPDHHHHHHPGIIKFSQNLNAPGIKNDKVVTLFGIKIGDIPESSPHHHLINGRRIPDGTVDFNLSRSVGVGVGVGGGFLGFGSAAVTYSSQPSVYGYSGLTLGGSAVGLTSGVTTAGGGGALLPPIPSSYMLDSRGGAPVIHHQITGSSTPGDLPPMFSQPSPFFMSVPCPNGCVGLPRNNNNNTSFDLNSGGRFIEGVGNRDSGGGGFILRQPPPPPPPINNNNNNDHHHHHQLRSSSSSGIVGTKRKEPDLGWETSSYPFRQHHPPPPTWR